MIVITLQVIVAVGGEDDKVVLRSVECYCTKTRTWKTLNCLPFAVRYITLICIIKSNSREFLYNCTHAHTHTYFEIYFCFNLMVYVTDKQIIL